MRNYRGKIFNSTAIDFQRAFLHEASRSNQTRRSQLSRQPRQYQHFTANMCFPNPVEEIEQVKAEMRDFSCSILKDALPPPEVTHQKHAVEQQAACETAAGMVSKDGVLKPPSQRLWTLINKRPGFLALLEHSLIHEISPEFLGDDNHEQHLHQKHCSSRNCPHDAAY